MTKKFESGKGDLRKGVGRPKADQKRLRTTVSLWLEIWDLATKIGGTRGRGLEKMAEFWLENHPETGQQGE